MIKIRKKSELSVITNAKKLANYVITITEKSPKKFRYSFVLKLHNLCIDLIENLYLSNSIKLGDERRRDYQLKSFTTLKLIDSISLMSYESKCILFKQYELISEKVYDCDRLLKTWVLSDDKRIGVKQ